MQKIAEFLILLFNPIILFSIGAVYQIDRMKNVTRKEFREAVRYGLKGEKNIMHFIQYPIILEIFRV